MEKGSQNQLQLNFSTSLYLWSFKMLFPTLKSQIYALDWNFKMTWNMNVADGSGIILDGYIMHSLIM